MSLFGWLNVVMMGLREVHQKLPVMGICSRLLPEFLLAIKRGVRLSYPGCSEMTQPRGARDMVVVELPIVKKLILLPNSTTLLI